MILLSLYNVSLFPLNRLIYAYIITDNLKKVFFATKFSLKYKIKKYVFDRITEKSLEFSKLFYFSNGVGNGI
tara:strand:- start:3446 stop:3661 length:216 start_codon:yes stop_codon:yes gene_type:complete